MLLENTWLDLSFSISSISMLFFGYSVTIRFVCVELIAHFSVWDPPWRADIEYRPVRVWLRFGSGGSSGRGCSPPGVERSNRNLPSPFLHQPIYPYPLRSWFFIWFVREVVVYLKDQVLYFWSLETAVLIIRVGVRESITKEWMQTCSDNIAIHRLRTSDVALFRSFQMHFF